MLLNYIKRLIFLRNHKSLVLLNMTNNNTINNNTINNDILNNLEILNKSNINNYYTFLKKRNYKKN